MWFLTKSFVAMLPYDSALQPFGSKVYKFVKENKYDFSQKYDFS